MKSLWWKYTYCGNERWSQKGYRRSMQKEIKDELFLKLDNREDSFEKLEAVMRNHIEQENTKEAIQRQQRRFRADYGVETHQRRKVSRFERFLSQAGEELMTNIFKFLTLSEMSQLLKVCQAIYKNKKVLAKMRELEFVSRFNNDNLFVSSLNQETGFLHNFYRSRDYELVPSKVLGTHTFFASKNLEIQLLTRYLVDYTTVKNLNARNILRTFVGNYLPSTLMLSRDPELNEVTIWAVNKQNGILKPFVIKKEKFLAEERVMATNFCSEKLLVIQTQEKEFDGLEKKATFHKIYIRNIKFEMNDSNLDHCLELMNEDFLIPIQLVQSMEDERRIKSKGILPGEFQFVKKDEKMYFYTSNVMFSYNLEARKIELVHVFEVENCIARVVTSSKADEKIYIFFKGSQPNILEYCPSQECFMRKDKTFGENGCRVKMYQYGRFEKFRMEYMILMRDDEFYLIDFSTSLEWKIVSKSSSLGTRKVFSWSVYENLLTVIYDKCDLYIFKLPLAEILKGKPDQAKLIGSKWINFSSYLSNSNDRILMYMNETYLVLVNLPGNSGSFDVLYIYVADIILNADMNLNKQWRVRGDDLINKNSSLFLKRLEDPDLSFDLIKFEDDKILIKFENMSLFFDLKSSFNENQKLEILPSEREWLDRIEFQIRYPVEISASKLNTKEEVSKSKKLQQYQALIPNKNCPLEKEGNIFELDLASDGEWKNCNEKTKSRLRKQIYFGIKEKIFRLKCADKYVIGLFNLQTISVDRQKEWVLRQMKRRKTNIKNTFKRRLHT